MGFDIDLDNTIGEQIHGANALSRLDFDDSDEDDWVGSALDSIYSVPINLVTQSKTKMELRSNRLFRDVIIRIKIGNWNQFSEAKKGFEKQKNALTITNGTFFCGAVLFNPPELRHVVVTKAHDIHPGKNAAETAVRMIAWWPGINQDVLRYISNCKECQEHKPKMGKKVSAWQAAELWKRLHVDLGYAKDKGSILVIVDAKSGWIESVQRQIELHSQ